MPLIDNQGHFHAHTDQPVAVDLAQLQPGQRLPTAIAIANDVSVDALLPSLGGVTVITIDFPSFADGRGFSLARRLRDADYRGTLHASGHIISDQLRHAFACGFNAIVINDALAARQPETVWREAAKTALPSYQKHLRMVAA